MNNELFRKYNKTFSKLKKLGIFKVLPQYIPHKCNLSTYGYSFITLKYDKLDTEFDCYDKDILQKISGIMFMNLSPNNKNKIFSPGFSCSNGHRSLSIEDLNIEFLSALYDVAEEIYSEPVILSRLFDVIWVSKGGQPKDIYKAGEKAFDYYNILLDELIIAQNWHMASDIFLRLNSLAFSLGRHFKKLQTHIDKLLGFLDFEVRKDNLFFISKIWEQIYNISWGDKREEVYGKLAIAIEYYISNNDEEINWQEHCSDLLAKIYTRLKKFDKQQQILEWIAEKQCEVSNSREEIYAKIHFLSRAIEAYKRINKNPCRDKIADIYKTIQELQNRKDTFYQTINFKEDVTEEVQKILNKYQNANLVVCLRGLWESKGWFIGEKSIKKIAESCEKSVLTDIFPISYQNHLNQTVCTDKEDRIEFMTKEHVRNVALQISVFPLLRIINDKFFFTEDTIKNLCRYNCFIPPNYEGLFAKGLYYFLKCMYIEAATILIPLVENSLRHILSVSRSTIHKKDKEDIYANKIEIEGLINLVNVEKILDENLLFHLKDLIVDSRYNVRNYIAHGLYPEEQFYSHNVISVLFIIFALCVDTFFGKEDKGKSL